ncbi:methyltransferase domain-containing protein [Nocardiopsis sediminis]|uniref:Protein-L-isoaspartate O-methyltransferase n=1 Tax=Nocardiopsis sediminis TaxID=1778267 RepID=A0ABV8FX83_9ACTN
MTSPEERSATLARRLRKRGILTGAWEQAFAGVPRHAFLPDEIWAPEAGAPGRMVPVGRDDPYWMDSAYDDVAVATQVDDGRPSGRHGRGRTVTSSVSQPSLVMAMLNAADLADGARVLEIGTGSGYNAALLSARLGSHNVTSVEIDPQVAGHARARLLAAGWAPRVVTGDGARGVPANAPYDRVLATVAANTIPYAWVEQTVPGGLVVTPWGTPYSSAGLLRLSVGDDGTAAGQVSGRAGFMLLRCQRAPLGGWRRYVDTSASAETEDSTTTVDLGDLVGLDGNARYAIGILVPELYQVEQHADDGSGEYTLWLFDANGSWAAADHTPGARSFRVSQHGPRALWTEVEEAYRWWTTAGRPGRDRFGLTVTPEGQTPWLDTPATPVTLDG